MPGATPSYPPEFKREAVRLVQFSPNRSIAQIARELGVSDNSLRSWLKQTEIDAGQREELTPPDLCLPKGARRVGCARRPGPSPQGLRACSTQQGLAGGHHTIPTRVGSLYLAFILDSHSRPTDAPQ
jgi:hypothetical protein